MSLFPWAEPPCWPLSPRLPKMGLSGLESHLGGLGGGGAWQRASLVSLVSPSRLLIRISEDNMAAGTGSSAGGPDKGWGDGGQGDRGPKKRRLSGVCEPESLSVDAETKKRSSELLNEVGEKAGSGGRGTPPSPPPTADLQVLDGTNIPATLDKLRKSDDDDDVSNFSGEPPAASIVSG